ncbi:MAG: hypothetical protein IJ502_01730 [Alistipes sp.]|nr:hypothetical protein [Alistipes sp.]
MGLRKWYENGRRASKNELFLIFFEGAADEGADDGEDSGADDGVDDGAKDGEDDGDDEETKPKQIKTQKTTNKSIYLNSYEKTFFDSDGCSVLVGYR